MHSWRCVCAEGTCVIIHIFFLFTLTGNCSATEMESYLATGFDMVVAKPFGVRDVRLALEQCVLPRLQRLRHGTCDAQATHVDAAAETSDSARGPDAV